MALEWFDVMGSAAVPAAAEGLTADANAGFARYWEPQHNLAKHADNLPQRTAESTEGESSIRSRVHAAMRELGQGRPSHPSGGKAPLPSFSMAGFQHLLDSEQSNQSFSWRQSSEGGGAGEGTSRATGTWVRRRRQSFSGGSQSTAAARPGPSSRPSG